jgi:hypothetical protein
MVTRDPHMLSKLAERSGALDLLERARQNYNLNDVSTPYTLRISFQTRGATQIEGEGTMDEVSDGAGHWRWEARLQDSLVLQIGGEGHVYGTNPSEPVPLRIQMLRSVLHWPITRDPAASTMRAANIKKDAKAVSCLLLSGTLPMNPAPRAWVETE